MSTVSYRVNAPDVVHEIIQGEAVVVNLSNGVYYSVDRAGADIWMLIESGTPVDRIVEILGERYTGNREDIEEGVEAFISQLRAENLIVPSNGSTDANPPSTPPELPAGYTPQFETPSLQRYTDMEDLLLLDPLHDVDEQEWEAGQEVKA